jgi:hypothetical protein
MSSVVRRSLAQVIQRKRVLYAPQSHYKGLPFRVIGSHVADVAGQRFTLLVEFLP